MDPAVAQHLERALGAVAHGVASGADGDAPLAVDGAFAGRDLLTASAAGRRLAGLPGAGSGAGSPTRSRRWAGGSCPRCASWPTTWVSTPVSWARTSSSCSRTSSGRTSWGRTVHEVASRAARHALPVVVVAREVVAGRREQAAAGISGTYAWGDGDPRDLVERVARTWSRG